MLGINASNVVGLGDYERVKLDELINIYNSHALKNIKKNRYYEGKIPLAEVNLGIALPETFSNLEIGCEWGAKAVDVLAARSMFDGFVSAGGYDSTEMDAIVQGNNLIAEYIKACRDELKYGCTFATLSKDDWIGCRIRFHSPQTAAAEWNGEVGRTDCGLAVVDSVPNQEGNLLWTPTVINLHMKDAVWVLRRRKDYVWDAERYPHQMGRPLMQPMVWNATSNKPFGRSRIKGPVRSIIQGYVRTVANATIGLEFATSPQKYLLGVTDEQYDAVISQKFRQYVGSIIASTTNPETGEKPTFGQLLQGNISPHVEMMRMLATQLSAATGLPVTDTGVINDANPTSSDAIEAQTKTLVGLAQELNTGNGDALQMIARMALAISEEKTLDDLTDEQMSIMAHFKNPAMPSVAVTADAAIKIASARPGFAETDTFLEMVGFSQADIRRIKAQEARSRGLQVLEDIGL